MQVELFVIPVFDAETGQERLNRFLKGHRILKLSHKLIDRGSNALWCFTVTYVDGESQSTRSSTKNREKIDYRDLLDEASFARFCALRKARKKIAQENSIPAFAVLTDKEMAALAERNPQSLESLKGIDRLGEGKIQRFGAAILEAIVAGASNAAENVGDNGPVREDH